MTPVGANPTAVVAKHNAADNPHAFTAAGLALARATNLAAQKELLEIPEGGGSGDVVGPASATTGHLAVFADETGKVLADGGAVPTGGGGFLQNLDCSTNPNFPEAEAGQYLTVGVSGRLGGEEGPAVAVGDVVICQEDSAEGDHETVGENWSIVTGRPGNITAPAGLTAIDCSTNPNFPAAQAGDRYYVSKAGKIGGASGLTVAKGDMLFSVEAQEAGTLSEVGGAWIRTLGAFALSASVPGSVWEWGLCAENQYVSVGGIGGGRIFIFTNDTSGTYYYSEDSGENWTTAYLPAALTVTSYLFAQNTHWVTGYTGGNTGKIYSSGTGDDSDWTEKFSANSKQITCLAFGEDTYVATHQTLDASGTGAYVSTDDGENWSAEALWSGYTLDITKVIYALSAFIVLGRKFDTAYRTAVWHRVSGTWTEYAETGETKYNSLTYLEDIGFVRVGTDSGKNKIGFSEDAQTWTDIGDTSDPGVQDVVADNGAFYAVVAQSTDGAIILRSEDGNTWEDRFIPDPAVNTLMTSLCTGDGVILAVGARDYQESPITANYLLSSS